MTCSHNVSWPVTPVLSMIQPFIPLLLRKLPYHTSTGRWKIKHQYKVTRGRPLPLPRHLSRKLKKSTTTMTNSYPSSFTVYITVGTIRFWEWSKFNQVRYSPEQVSGLWEFYSGGNYRPYRLVSRRAVNHNMNSQREMIPGEMTNVYFSPLPSQPETVDVRDEITQQVPHIDTQLNPLLLAFKSWLF